MLAVAVPAGTVVAVVDAAALTVALLVVLAATADDAAVEAAEESAVELDPVVAVADDVLAPQASSRPAVATAPAAMALRRIISRRDDTPLLNVRISCCNSC